MSDLKFRSEFGRVLQERGFIHQITDAGALDAKAADGRVVAYIGFDATAPSLHAGSLVQIMMLRWLQKCGHKPIVLMGGGTTKVGDPSGKDTARQLLDDAAITANMESLKRAFAPFLSFGDGPTDAVMIDNDDWLSTVPLHRIPARVRAALHHQPHADLRQRARRKLDREQPLTFLEFNYMLMQAVDFLGALSA